MKENDKYGSKLYKPTKPYHKMSMKELSDHCKICKSLDKMTYNRIKKIENLSYDVLQKKIKHFLERNNGRKLIRKTKKSDKTNTRKQKLEKVIYNNKTKKQNGKKQKKTKKTNI